MSGNEQLDRLTALPRVLLNEGYCDIPLFRVLREHAINGRFPAVQVNRIWHFAPSKLTTIANRLGLPKADADQNEAA